VAFEASHGKHKAYVYYFDRPSARDPNGSTHGQAVGNVFGNLGVGGRDAPTAEDRAICAQMPGYWVNFATTGEPNGSGLPFWPAFSGTTPMVMRISLSPGPAPVPNSDRLKVLDAHGAWRRHGSN
jgi:para-nitrobenzyl esterase